MAKTGKGGGNASSTKEKKSGGSTGASKTVSSGSGGGADSGRVGGGGSKTAPKTVTTGGNNRTSGGGGKTVTISKSSGKVSYGNAGSSTAKPGGRTVEKAAPDRGFFSAGKQFVNSAKEFGSSLKNTFGPGPSQGRMVTDPKTGKTYKEPTFKAGTLKGLTSTDPANVARNRQSAKMYADNEAKRRAEGNYRNEDKRGSITPVSSAPVAPVAPTAPTYTSEQLAAIGAPTVPLTPAPVEVETPSYGLASLAPAPEGQAPAAPLPGYDQAFMNPYSPFQDMGAMDIFGVPQGSSYLDNFGVPMGYPRTT